MPALDSDLENNQDISEDIEYISENHLIHFVEVDSEDDNDFIEMESESGDESPENNEVPNFDISSLTFIARFYRIISCLENILNAMRRCLITYPPESVVGSSLRSRNLNFLTSWRLIFEKVHLFFGSSACVMTLVTNQKISADTIYAAIQNMNKEDENWLENGISVVTGVKDRIDFVLESLSSINDDKAAKDALKNLDDLIFKEIALIPDGDDSYEIVKDFYEKLEAHLP